jgi:hypothetical protein
VCVTWIENRVVNDEIEVDNLIEVGWFHINVEREKRKRERGSRLAQLVTRCAHYICKTTIHKFLTVVPCSGHSTTADAGPCQKWHAKSKTRDPRVRHQLRQVRFDQD